jgi:hypothetical protein
LESCYLISPENITVVPSPETEALFRDWAMPSPN